MLDHSHYPNFYSVIVSVITVCSSVCNCITLWGRVSVYTVTFTHTFRFTFFLGKPLLCKSLIIGLRRVRQEVLG